MSKHERIIEFVKQNLEMMLREDFPHDLFMDRRKSFFIESRKKTRKMRASNKEITKAAISYMIRIGKIDTEESLQDILVLPFFSKNAGNRDRYFQELRERLDSIPDVDLTDMSELEHKAKLYDWALRKAREEANIQFKQIRARKESQLLEMIEQKQSEYKSLPSVLDTPDIDEPDVPDSHIERQDEYIPWWKKLHMWADPFPTLEGLSHIPDEFYEAVLHKTKLFQQYEYIIEEVPEEILKNTIIFGEFGSGKTTFFEYLIKMLWSEGIPAIYLQIFSQDKVDLVIRKFKLDLSKELRGMLETLLKDELQITETNDIEEEIVSILRAYCETDSPKGFIVFIDDLHKNTAYTNVSLDFLNYLQLFTAKLNRSLDGPRISFFVAGALEWYPIVSREPKYSGSFSNRERIEDITVDNAYTMLNLRLKPFWPNPELKREVKREFVEREHAFLKDNAVPLTYRSFIHRVRERFREGEFDILSSDPITFSYDTLKGIQDIIERNQKLKSKFELLFKSISNKWNQKKTLEQLGHIFLLGGIEDNEPLLKKYYYHYQKMKSAQLIVKQKTKSGSFLWVICPELVEQNRLVMEKYQVSLESYLSPLYGVTVRKRTTVDEEMELIDSLIELQGNVQAKKYLEIVKEYHNEIVTEQKAFKTRLTKVEIIELCERSLETFSQVYFTYIDPVEISLDPIGQWSRYWFFPSETQQFLKLVEEEETFDKRIWSIINIYRQTFATLLNFIMKQCARMDVFPIVSLDLTNKESQKMNKIKSDWINTRYTDSATKLHKLMQSRLATYLRNIFSLLYGDMENRIKHIPRKIRQRHFEPPPIASHRSTFNEFMVLKIKDFSSIITGEDDAISSENWMNIFCKVFSEFKDKTLTQIFHNLNRVHHLQFEGEDNIELLKQLILDSIRLLQKLNSSYISLVTEGVWVDTSKDEPSFFIGFDSELRSGLTPINLDIKLCNEMKSQIRGTLIQLDDPKSIEGVFGCTYRQFVTFLGLGLKGNIEKVYSESWKLVVSGIVGPNIAIRIEDIVQSSPEEISRNLIQKLRNIPSGQDGWRSYEDLCITILNFLFSPSLIVPPKVQSYTDDRRERRDAVYRISASGSSIWNQIWHDFNTMFVVVEFKNLTDEPEDKDVQQLGSYLVKVGHRMVGFLCSRESAGASATARRTKLYRNDGKLIIFLSDNDLVEMLKLKSREKNPSELIMEQVSDFLGKLT